MNFKIQEHRGKTKKTSDAPDVQGTHIKPLYKVWIEKGSNLLYAFVHMYFSFEYSIQIKKSRDNECPHSFIREMLTAFLLSHQQ
jgi:hypothetical protein